MLLALVSHRIPQARHAFRAATAVNDEAGGERSQHVSGKAGTIVQRILAPIQRREPRRSP